MKRNRYPRNSYEYPFTNEECINIQYYIHSHLIVYSIICHIIKYSTETAE